MQKMPPEPFQCQSTFHCSIILFGSVSLISESQAFSTFTRERNTNPFFHYQLLRWMRPHLIKVPVRPSFVSKQSMKKKSGLSAGKWDRISYSFPKTLSLPFICAMNATIFSYGNNYLDLKPSIYLKKIPTC